MELTEAELVAIERNAEQVLALVDELRQRMLAPTAPTPSPLVPAIRALQSVRCQVQDLEDHLGEVLTGPTVEVEASSPPLHWRK